MNLNLEPKSRQKKGKIMWRCILLLGVAVCLGCSKDKSNKTPPVDTTHNQNSDENKGSSKNGSDTGAGESEDEDLSSETKDTQITESSAVVTDGETDTQVPFGTTELLYEFPELEGAGGDIFSLYVDDKYLYFMPLGGIFRMDKAGGDEPVPVGGFPSGGSHQNMGLDESAVYWLSNNAVKKVDKVTFEETSLPFSEPDEEPEMNVMLVEDDRIYLASMGCTKIIEMTKDGGTKIVSERTGEVSSCTSIVLTADDTHVYCATGRCDSKIVRVPKGGGEVTELLTLPERLGERAWLQPQAIGLSVVSESMYIITGFKDGITPQFFGVAPSAGGDYTRIADLIRVWNTRIMHHDEERKALYFYAPGETGKRGIYKYDLTTKTMSHTPVSEAGGKTMALDNEYIYFHTRSQIYRMKKF